MWNKYILLFPKNYSWLFNYKIMHYWHLRNTYSLPEEICFNLNQDEIFDLIVTAMNLKICLLEYISS
jgi:hypothetical protein